MLHIFHFESFDLVSQHCTRLIHKVFHIFAGLDKTLLSVRHQVWQIFPQGRHLVNRQLEILAYSYVVRLTLRLKRIDGLKFVIKFYFSKRQVRKGVHLLNVLFQLGGDSVKHF